ncbi:acyl-CoA thioesterase [Amorphus sp. 3PC139-8]|uniref:acyl-CoA thioesterase n=1 Tax=Amorphus sp. 3PC139-8 TaxID=2735676 RepID=UPI00345D5D6D
MKPTDDEARSGESDGKGPGSETDAAWKPGGLSTFVHPIKVRWADCDLATIAYTGRIPNFALEAIDAWWEAVVGFDWYRLSMDKGYSTPFVHMSIDFLSPVTPRSVLECAVRPLTVGDSSIRFEVVGRQAGVRCFAGEFVCVFIETGPFEKRPIVPEIRALIEAWMG